MHSLYQQQIMDHYHFPRHKGVLINAGYLHSASANPSCGDKIALTICVENGIIKAAKFDGVGCILSLAAADMLLDQVIGNNVQDIKKITVDDIKKMVGIDVGHTRIKCILLPLDALTQILKDA